MRQSSALGLHPLYLLHPEYFSQQPQAPCCCWLLNLPPIFSPFWLTLLDGPLPVWQNKTELVAWRLGIFHLFFPLIINNKHLRCSNHLAPTPSAEFSRAKPEAGKTCLCQRALSKLSLLCSLQAAFYCHLFWEMLQDACSRCLPINQSYIHPFWWELV